MRVGYLISALNSLAAVIWPHRPGWGTSGHIAAQIPSQLSTDLVEPDELLFALDGIGEFGADRRDGLIH